MIMVECVLNGVYVEKPAFTLISEEIAAIIETAKQEKISPENVLDFAWDGITAMNSDSWGLEKKTLRKIFYLALYSRYSATDKYCVLTVDSITNTVKYRVYSMPDLIDSFTTTTTSAGEITARLLVSKDLKKDLINNGYIIGSEYEYNALLASGLNRGQALECMMSNYFQCEYKRDSIPFYISGDINWLGIEYQVKSHKATFSNLKALKNLLANEIYKSYQK